MRIGKAIKAFAAAEHRHQTECVTREGLKMQCLPRNRGVEHNKKRMGKLKSICIQCMLGETLSRLEMQFFNADS